MCTCVLWSGGKDSFLAYLLSRDDQKADNPYVFVTFVPKSGVFRCHPLPILARHGASWGVPHEFIVIDEANWLTSYRLAFQFLKARYGIERVITGDILSDRFQNTYWVTGVPGFKVALDHWTGLLKEMGIKFEAPLSTLYAEEILALLDTHEIRAVVTGMAKEWFVEGMLGKSLSLELLKSTRLYEDPLFDLCGEHGEYHTTVVAFKNTTFCNLNFGCLLSTLFNGVWVLDWDKSWLEFAGKRTIV